MRMNKKWKVDPSEELLNSSLLEIRKELRKLDQNTKKDGGVIDWNRMLNDFM